MAFVAFQIILATVFGVSAISKLLSFSAFKNSLHNFFGKVRYVQLIAITVIAAELTTAVAITFLQFNEVGLWIALFLLAAFTGLVILNLTRGRSFPCSCFGSTSSNPISWWDVGRNVVFSFLTIYLLVTRSKNDYPLTPMLILMFVALCTLAWFIVIRLVRRPGSPSLKNSSLTLNNSTAKKHFPNVKMPDGSLLSIEHFLLQGKPVALFVLDFQFTSSQRVFDDVMNHFNALQRVFTVVLIAKNAPAEIIEISRCQAFDIASQVDYSVSNFFEVTGVPSLVTLNGVGEMLSRLTGESALVTALSSSGFDSLLKPAGTLNENYFKKISNSELADLVMYDQKGRLISFPGSKENMLLVFWSPYCSACRGLLTDISRLNSENRLFRTVIITPADHKAIENFDSIVIDKGFVFGKKLSITGTPSSILNLPGTNKYETYLAVGKENIVHLINQFQVLVSNSTLRSKIYETVN